MPAEDGVSDRRVPQKFHLLYRQLMCHMTDSNPTIADARTLLQWVLADHLDMAIDAGLMAWTADGEDALDHVECALLTATCRRLRKAWMARERFRARKARLQRREHERLSRRAASAPASTPSHFPAQATVSSALPTAAAAILTRARARAGIGSK